MPPLRRTPPSCSSISPLIAKPSASSLPSPVWPPTSAQPASLSTATAPAIIWNTVSSTLLSSPGGTVAIAVADCGLPPMAKMSPSAWLAAMRPNSQGSSMKARKKSTVCTSALPGGTRSTAASSGAFKPISTSSRSIGWTLASARDSTVAPTFAPQPPQRMAIAEIACVRSPSSSGTASAVVAACSAIGPSSLKRRMKRRSIQSFQRHTQSPRAKNAPREATACRSPVLISASQRRCGR